MISCCSLVLSLSKLSMTLFASLWRLLWSLTASTRLVVRPSWRKKRRCPTSQRGLCGTRLGRRRLANSLGAFDAVYTMVRGAPLAMVATVGKGRVEGCPLLAK
jgi:hypothetical protein